MAILGPLAIEIWQLRSECVAELRRRQSAIAAETIESRCWAGIADEHTWRCRATAATNRTAAETMLAPPDTGRQ